MTYLRVPSDETMNDERQAGRYVCKCETPTVEQLALWGCSQCQDCGKPIVPSA